MLEKLFVMKQIGDVHGPLADGTLLVLPLADEPTRERHGRVMCVALRGFISTGV